MQASHQHRSTGDKPGTDIFLWKSPKSEAKEEENRVHSYPESDLTQSRKLENKKMACRNVHALGLY
jgi:hypothetical protein